MIIDPCILEKPIGRLSCKMYAFPPLIQQDAVLTVPQIAEVKNYFAEHKKQLDEQAQRVQASKTDEAFPQGPTFLFGGVNPPEFPELLHSLPQKVITDKVIARYFNSSDPAIRK